MLVVYNDLVWCPPMDLTSTPVIVVLMLVIVSIGFGKNLYYEIYCRLYKIDELKAIGINIEHYVNSINNYLLQRNNSSTPSVIEVLDNIDRLYNSHKTLIILYKIASIVDISLAILLPFIIYSIIPVVYEYVERIFSRDRWRHLYLIVILSSILYLYSPRSVLSMFYGLLLAFVLPGWLLLDAIGFRGESRLFLAVSSSIAIVSLESYTLYLISGRISWAREAIAYSVVALAIICYVSTVLHRRTFPRSPR